MGLRKRLSSYVNAVEQGLENKPDNDDSLYFQGYDQALRNVTWGLRRMLNEEGKKKK